VVEQKLSTLNKTDKNCGYPIPNSIEISQVVSEMNLVESHAMIHKIGCFLACTNKAKQNLSLANFFTTIGGEKIFTNKREKIFSGRAVNVSGYIVWSTVPSV